MVEKGLLWLNPSGTGELCDVSHVEPVFSVATAQHYWPKIIV